MSLSEKDLEDLRYAKDLLESPALSVKIANLIGLPIEKGLELLPDRASGALNAAAGRSLKVALDFALCTMNDRRSNRSTNTLHKLLVAATGAGGGAFGWSALAVELPVSTTIMLRSIADIARSEGEPIRSVEAKLACLEVFALGARSKGDDAAESAYFAMRLALARALTEAAEYIAKRGLVQEGAPAVARFITQVAARFGIVVSEKAAAQAIPAIGAAGGALINVLFIDHFQDVARGHFVIRRLERLYDPDLVRRKYLELGPCGTAT